MELSSSEPFPLSSLCPKSETGVTNFLAKEPTYDGRGVVIAIFDSGVDPGAPGLRETTTGQKKVIERYDCSGAGDVITSTVVNMSSDRTIKGATGNVFKIPDNWECPSNSFHVGRKALFDLYPCKVRERIEALRKEREWDPALRATLSAATRRLNADNNNNNKATDSSSLTEKYNKEESEAQVEMLSLLDKKFKDPGPILDCIVWFDGTIWRACLTVYKESEDLSSSLVLGEFSSTQDFGFIMHDDQMSISINVWEDGNRLEVVGMSGSHGTHVASIAAGYFPENPDLNGVAPGAQIVSFSIGDSRLNTMETGTALVRAMSQIMRNPTKYHVINMSYGEHAHWAAHGRLGELMKEVVDKYGISWVVSGGNHGPALSTVGTPPWTLVNTLIGVGAYVSPEMMTAEYSLREKLPGMPYTWSSRGPTPDGDLGINVCAPGGAITSVPGFTLRSAQLMNGTSMAAPHVTGVIALLLCGSMARKFDWSPFSVKKALMNSATFLPKVESFAQGSGLVQVEKAFNLLETYSKCIERDVRFNISVTSSGLQTGWPLKGIYIRDPQIHTAKEYVVSVDPVFFKDDTIEPEKKIDFRMNLLLVGTVPWIQVPKYFDLANMQRSFNVKVQPEGLPAGAHYARVDAFDVNNISKGPVFCVDVTVIKAQQALTAPYFRPTVEFPNVVYSPGDIQRYFISTPKGASWATLNLKLLSGQSSSRFVIHSMCLHAGHSCITEEFYKMVNLQPQEETNLAFSVTENYVLELVIARWWGEPSEHATLSAVLSFRSVTVNKQELVMSAGDAYSKLLVTNSFSTEEICPAVTLKHQVQLLRPTDVKLSALSDPRDVIPEHRVIYELVSTYNFSLSRATEITVNCSLLSDTLYECEYESQLWMLFDSNKRYLNSGDAYPSKWSTKVEKGDYILRLCIRHEKREALEKFLAGGTSGGNGGTSGVPSWSGDSQVPVLPVLLSMKLSTNITLDTYPALYDVQDSRSSKKANSSVVLKGASSINVFVSTAISDKSIKTLPGSSTLYLQGTITLTKDEQGKKVSGLPVKICIPEPPPKTKSAGAPSKSQEKTKLEEMDEQLRDVSINWLSKLQPEDSKGVYEDLCTKYESHLPLHVARLNYLDSNGSAAGDEEKKGGSTDKTKSREVLEEIIKLSDKILSNVDRPSLLAYYGTKASASSNQTDAAKTKQLMDKQRSSVIESLVKKGTALAELSKIQPNANLADQLDTIFQDVNKFAEVTDARILELSVQHALSRDHYGRALRFLYKQYEADSTKWTAENDARMIELFEKLGWKMCTWNWELGLAHRYPKDFRPF